MEKDIIGLNYIHAQMRLQSAGKSFFIASKDGHVFLKSNQKKGTFMISIRDDIVIACYKSLVDYDAYGVAEPSVRNNVTYYE